jgi:hypothetical protein
MKILNLAKLWLFLHALYYNIIWTIKICHFSDCPV